MRERLVNTRDGAEEVLRRLENSVDVTLDTETSGLDWTANHIVGYVLTFRDGPSCYIPVRHAGGGNLPGCAVPQTPTGWKGDLHWFEVALSKLVSFPVGLMKRKIVGHNLIFDLRFCHKHGIVWYANFEDTSINEPLIDENTRAYSLDASASRRDVQTKKGAPLYAHIAELMGIKLPEKEWDQKKLMEHFWRTNAETPVVWEYAAGDGVTTEELVDKQTPILTEEDDMGRSLIKVHGVECRMIKTLYRMTVGGVKINEETLHRADEKFAKMGTIAAGKFPEGFNPKSSNSMKALLGDAIGTNWPRNPPTIAEMKKARSEGRAPLGALKFDADTLKLVPEGRNVIDLRQVMNARSLYTQPMIHHHLTNGHVYCDFAQMAQDDYGTISGRLSCYDPNLQAVSKRNKKIGPIYRSAFEPDDGCTWEDNDYAQQEYVVFTDYSGDPILMAGYAAEPPVDIHQSVADMLGIERDPGAKRMNLGMLYGMGLEKLARSLGVSMAQAKLWMDEYHRKFPNARKFMKGAEAKCRLRGFVFTYLGRRRHFNYNTAHKAGNGIIQGSSADITKLKMVEIDEYFESEGDDCRLMLQIHDSLSWSAPDDENGRRQTAEARRIMADFSPGQPISLRARLRIDTSTGANWAQATWSDEVCDLAWAA